jgi:hypothetical protein
VLHAVLLASGCCVPIDTNTFGISVLMGMLRSGTRSILMENNLLNSFLYFLIKSETRIIDGASPFSHMLDMRIEGASPFN